MVQGDGWPVDVYNESWMDPRVVLDSISVVLVEEKDIVGLVKS